MQKKKELERYQDTQDTKGTTDDGSGLDSRPEAVAFLPEEIARRYLALPLRFSGSDLVVALADPNDLVVLDDLRIFTGRNIVAVRTDRRTLERSLDRVYQGIGPVKKEVEQVAAGSRDEEDELQVRQESPAVRLADIILGRAGEARASDIHIDPQEDSVRVRFRVDGILRNVMKLPKKAEGSLTSRFKVFANLDVAERRRPQDGHATTEVDGKPVDLRVASLPTICGERIVIRLLPREAGLLDLSELAFTEDNRERFERACQRPHGLVLVTGPTGSGKSTTLYAALNLLNTPEKNVVTIEDPVEYHVPGITQIPVETKSGLTFARGLRAVLRADPDVVMVGEIRDQETARTAIEAGLTGHLVFSTLHTNDACSAPIRLVEMGIEPFLVADSVICVEAQRLARRLCPHCRESFSPSAEILSRLELPQETAFYRGGGCGSCENTGYRGRIGLHEVITIAPELRPLLAEGVPAEELRQAAARLGFPRLLADGLAKASAGLTSLEEVLRVVR